MEVPVSVELQAGEFNDFEGDDGGWDVYAWKNFFYDSEEAEKEGPRIYSGYFYMSADERSMPVLVVKFSRSGRFVSHSIAYKRSYRVWSQMVRPLYSIHRC